MNDRLSRIEATRERELNRKSIGPLPESFDIDIVGIAFQPFFPSNLYELEAINLEAEVMGEKVPVVFIREPDNEHDPNCVAVHVPALDQKIGCVPRALAARFAPHLDAEEQWLGEVAYIRFNQDHPDKPGITITARKVE